MCKNVYSFADKFKFFICSTTKRVFKDAYLIGLTKEQLHSGGRASRGNSARGQPLSLSNFYCKYIRRKRLTSKIKVKVTEHNIRNGAMRWQILKSTSTAFTISEILAIQIFYLENLDKGSGVQQYAFAMMPFDGKYQPL